MGLPPPKPVIGAKLRAIYKYDCDGVARYAVRGRPGPLTYSDAFDAVLQDSGGSSEMKDGKETRNHTKESMRRIAALNLRYLGLPEVRLFLQAEYAKKVMAQQAELKRQAQEKEDAIAAAKKSEEPVAP